MLDIKTFKEFIKKANQAHRQFCIWVAANNEFAKHRARWNQSENFTGKHECYGCRYKNFWEVVVPTLQHGFALAMARLFDPAYHPTDKKQKRPRISLDYMLIKLEEEALLDSIGEQLKSHQLVINSLKNFRVNFLAHNDASFTTTRIEAGVENLFQWLENTIAKIKEAKPHLSNCGVIDIGYNEKLSQCGVDEVFETLLLGEKHEQ